MIAASSEESEITAGQLQTDIPEVQQPTSNGSVAMEIAEIEPVNLIVTLPVSPKCCTPAK